MTAGRDPGATVRAGDAMAPGTVLLVTGDRYATFPEWRDAIGSVLSEVRPDLIVHGAARGIDRLVAMLGKQRGIADEPFPFRSELGARGGPMRNRDMVLRVRVLQARGWIVFVVAFHDDLAGSKGTADCVRAARFSGLRVTLVGSDGEREEQGVRDG